MNALELNGEKFKRETFLEARRICKKVVSKIAQKTVLGMSENEGQQLIKEEFKRENIEKFWHPSKFRIGRETVKSFREAPEEGVRLEAGDVFFLDVGPIFEEHEADYGETFVFDSDSSEDQPLYLLAEAAKLIWMETESAWKENHLSGNDLYDFADSLARRKGYSLNPLMAGHRLGDFPHALFSKEKLSAIGIVPSANLWVLEIHIISDALKRGAFYEDILCS